MVTLRKMQKRDLKFRELLLKDKKTMSFNSIINSHLIDNYKAEDYNPIDGTIEFNDISKKLFSDFFIENQSNTIFGVIIKFDPIGEYNYTIFENYAEIGFIILSNKRNKGYGSVVLETLIDHIKLTNENISEIIINFDPNKNIEKSINFLLKRGFIIKNDTISNIILKLSL